jgi:membrane associated rhomboid family serine protease
MFPLRDENPTEITPIVTVALIAANVLVWLFVESAGVGDRFIEALCVYGAIPGEITGALGAGTELHLGEHVCRIGGLGKISLITSMFLHGGWMHLIGNMWFLWVFGNNIEDSMGHLRFVVFYLATGIVAAGAHVVSDTGSGVPMVGASGAISGVMGAYIVLYPKVRVQSLVILFYFIRVISVPAGVLLAIWFGLQLVQGALSGYGGTGGVAFWAHIGGFVAGVALIKLFERRKLVDAKRHKHKLSPEELSRWERW